jgi:DNA-binding CsgD family transcriptional regulator
MRQRRSTTERWATGAVRILLQDRRRLLRDGISLLAAEEDVHLDAVADAEGVLEVIDRSAIDVLVVEVGSVDWSIAELVAAVRDRCGAVLVVGLHAGRRSDHTAVARSAKIDVLLPYAAGASALFDAVRGREPHLQPAPTVERRVLPGREVLTPREREVLRHISAGLTTQQSAQLLEVSPKTVDNHKQRMFAKLGVQNQAHAVAVAHRCGILRPSHQEASGA